MVKLKLNGFGALKQKKVKTGEPLVRPWVEIVEDIKNDLRRAIEWYEWGLKKRDYFGEAIDKAEDWLLIATRLYLVFSEEGKRKFNSTYPELDRLIHTPVDKWEMKHAEIIEPAKEVLTVSIIYEDETKNQRFWTV